SLVQTPVPWSNVRRADDPVWRVSNHLFGGGLANYIQLDIIETCGRCVSLVILSNACETSPRARGMMRVINSTCFSEATSPTTSSRCPPSARVSRRSSFRLKRRLPRDVLGQACGGCLRPARLPQEDTSDAKKGS